MRYITIARDCVSSSPSSPGGEGKAQRSMLLKKAKECEVKLKGLIEGLPDPGSPVEGERARSIELIHECAKMPTEALEGRLSIIGDIAIY